MTNDNIILLRNISPEMYGKIQMNNTKKYNINIDTLNKIMRKKAINQVKLAKEAKISTRTVNRIFKENTYNPNNRTIEEIAKVLKVDPTTLCAPYSDKIGKHPRWKRYQNKLEESIEISNGAIKAYDFIKEKWLLNKDDVIEMAPLMLLILANQSIEKRKIKLDEFKQGIKILDDKQSSIKAALGGVQYQNSCEYERFIDDEEFEIQNFSLDFSRNRRREPYLSNSFLDFLIEEAKKFNTRDNSPIEIKIDEKLYFDIQSNRLNNDSGDGYRYSEPQKDIATVIEEMKKANDEVETLDIYNYHILGNLGLTNWLPYEIVSEQSNIIKDY